MALTIDIQYFPKHVQHWRLRDKQVIVTKARPFLSLRVERRSPHVERSCSCIEYAVTDSREKMVLHFKDWAMSNNAFQ